MTTPPSRFAAPVRIDDPADPRLDDYRNLNSSDNRPDLPGGKGLVIAEGNLVVPRLVLSRYPVRSVVGFGSKLRALREEESTWGNEVPTADPIPTYEVTREVLAAVAGFDMHRGLVAAADRVPELSVEEVLERDHSGIIAILEGVGNHENIGSIFRNAAGLDVGGVLFGAATADPLYRRSVRVSMGHVLRTPWARLAGTTTTWQRSLREVQERGYTIIALTPSADATLDEALAAAPGKVAMLVGAEGPGLTEHAMRAADIRAKIPMAAGTDSLNVATAAAVAFYAAGLRK